MINVQTNRVEDFLVEHLEDFELCPLDTIDEPSDEDCVDRLLRFCKRLVTLEARIVFSSYSLQSRSRIKVEPLLSLPSPSASLSLRLATVFTTAAFFLNLSNMPVSPP